MKDWLRRGIVFTVKKLMTEKTSNNIYDYTTSKHYHFSGSNKSIYDYDLGSHISISGTSSKYRLYHYKNSNSVTLEIEDSNKFKGYDYDSGYHFSGKLSGSSITLYDYETGQYYNYSL